MASYDFKPLPEGLASALDEIKRARDGSGWSLMDGPGLLDEVRELEALGLLDHLSVYLDGSFSAHVTSKGGRYRDELSSWEADRERERLEELERERRASRREWAIGIAGAVATITASIISYFIGATFG